VFRNRLVEIPNGEIQNLAILQGPNQGYVADISSTKTFQDSLINPATSSAFWAFILINSCFIPLPDRILNADTLIGNLTVMEMLLYTAELKNPTAMPLSEKHAKVSSLILLPNIQHSPKRACKISQYCLLCRLTMSLNN